MKLFSWMKRKKKMPVAVSCPHDDLVELTTFGDEERTFRCKKCEAIIRFEQEVEQ